MNGSEVDVVNIVAVGDLAFEVDIEQVAKDISLDISNYNERSNASYFRFEEDGELIVLFTSGKYAIRGGDDMDELCKNNNRFISCLSELGLEIDNPKFEVKNVVSVGDLGVEVDLESLAVVLGLEQVEYEPEQFPGLVYRPSDEHVVLLIFSSGKVVITGGKTISEDENAFGHLKETVT